MEINNEEYEAAMKRLEENVDKTGLGSLSFADGELVMISVSMMKNLIDGAEKNGQNKVFFFVNTNPVEETNEPA
jgi:hypothetical protein